MKYKPELGIWGNLDNALKEVAKTNSKMESHFDEAKTIQEDTDALLVDQEFRLTLLELGLTE